MSHTSKIPPAKYATSDLPTDLEVGSLVFDSDTSEHKVFNGSSWDVVSGGGESFGTATIVSSNASTYDQIQGDITSSSGFSFNSSLKGLVIGTSCTSIGSYAFQFCTGLTGSLIIPDSVIIIGNDAFSYCDGLTGSLTIPNSVTTIIGAAFNSCTGFNGPLTIGNSVTSIGGNAFNSCTGLTGSLTIPDSVTTIGNSAFYNCTGFNGILTIGNSVTSIGSSAFNNCTGLTAVYTNTPASSFIGSGAFHSTTFTTIYTGPNATGYTASFQGRTGLTISPWTNYPNIP